MDISDQSQAGSEEAASPAQAVAASLSREERVYPDDQPKDRPAEPQERPPQERAETPDKAYDDYRLEMPDGVQIDQDLLVSAVPTLREAGISNEQANKLVPLVTHVQNRLYQSQADHFSKLRSDWAKAAQADDEIGGERWKETGRLAAVALTAGGAGEKMHEARQLLNESGLGNHPAMVRLFRRMGAEIERLQRVAGAGRETRTTRLERAYPDDPAR